MSDLREIKNRIYDEALIHEVLIGLECDYINEEQNGNLITAQLPQEFQSKNKRAIQIKNTESLTSYIRNKGIKGDIFSVIGYILFGCQEFEDVKENLFEIKAWLCNLFDWHEYMDEIISMEEKPKKKEVNQFIKSVLAERKEREKKQSGRERKNKSLDKNILSRYIIQPHVEFIKSGIKCKTQKVFEVGYCMETQRVIYPIYDIDGENIIGIKGRYVGKNKTVAETKKYLYLIPCDKSIVLFNYHRAKPFIQKTNEVFVFESAKSVMLAYQYGYKNAVSLEGNEMSFVQAYLLKQLGFNVKITFCFDKDMELDFVKKQVKMIPTRMCFAIIDKDHKLDNKDSPIDKGKSIWEFLYKNHKYKMNCYNTESRKEKKKK